jgi:hypothetical protein
MKGIQAQHQSINQSIKSQYLEDVHEVRAWNASEFKLPDAAVSPSVFYWTEHGKESSRSAHANGMNEWMNEIIIYLPASFVDIRSVDVGTKIVKHS